MNITDEQRAVIQTVAVDDKSCAVNAYAGTGKTTTLVKLSQCLIKGTQYVVFNKRAADEAGRKMPYWVKANTLHSLAFKAVGQPFAERLQGSGGRDGKAMSKYDVAKECGADKHRYHIGDRHLKPGTIGSLILRTVTHWCQSAGDTIGPENVPHVPGIASETARAELVDLIVPLAGQAWKDICRPDGILPYTHDNYLKLWALCGPVLNCDLLMIDEAQDQNGVGCYFVNYQRQRGIPVVAVGDTFQQIYEWRGTIDALRQLELPETLYLTQSWRFGQSVADLVTPLIHHLDSEVPALRGNPDLITNVIWPGQPSHLAPDAILCRTNSYGIEVATQMIEEGRKVHYLGGTSNFTDFCKGILALQSGKSSWHPWLAAFTSWDELKRYIRSEEAELEDPQFVSLMKMVFAKGAKEIIDTLNQCVSHNQADIHIGTAHQAKGGEWPVVRLGNDFPNDIEKLTAEDFRLLYVAMTRGQRTLDLSGLDDTLEVLSMATNCELTPERYREIAYGNIHRDFQPAPTLSDDALPSNTELINDRKVLLEVNLADQIAKRIEQIKTARAERLAAMQSSNA